LPSILQFPVDLVWKLHIIDNISCVVGLLGTVLKGTENTPTTTKNRRTCKNGRYCLISTRLFSPVQVLFLKRGYENAAFNAHMKRFAAQRADEVYLLADSSKLGKKALNRVLIRLYGSK